MKKILIHLMLLTVLLGCKKIVFEPSIIFNENNGKTEISITLPEGGSKILKIIDGPLLDSGDGDLGLGILDNNSLENNLNDKTFKNVSKYFAKIAGTNNVFFIYKNYNNKYVVYWESRWEAGLSDSGIIFNGDIKDLKNNEPSNIAEYKTIIFGGKSDMRTGVYLENHKYILKTSGNEITIYSYVDEKLLFTEKGKLVNGTIYLNGNNTEEVTYSITNNEFCISGEGQEYCFPKIYNKDN